MLEFIQLKHIWQNGAIQFKLSFNVPWRQKWPQKWISDHIWWTGDLDLFTS